MGNPKFQILKGADHHFYFRLKAKNGEIILQSEAYTSKAGCKNGIESAKTNAPFDNRYDRKTASNGQYYFVLKATNGEIIGVSEMNKSKAARDNGIKAIKRAAPKTLLEDLV